MAHHRSCTPEVGIAVQAEDALRGASTSQAALPVHRLSSLRVCPVAAPLPRGWPAVLPPIPALPSQSSLQDHDAEVSRQQRVAACEHRSVGSRTGKVASTQQPIRSASDDNANLPRVLDDEGAASTCCAPPAAACCRRPWGAARPPIARPPQLLFERHHVPIVVLH
jgi:hypothetical protein